MTSLRTMTNDELIGSAKALVRRSAETEAALLAHLVEMDERGLYRESRWPHLFGFCVEELGFSEDQASNRITAPPQRASLAGGPRFARASRRFPQLLEALRAGRVHLSGLRVLAPVLTDDNVERLLSEAAGRSKRQIEELAAREAPRPAVPDSIRKTPTPSPTAMEPTLPLVASAPPQAPQPAVPAPSAPPPPPRPVVAPLSAEQYRGPQRAKLAGVEYRVPPVGDSPGSQFTASRALRDKLREAQALLRHQVPNGDLAEIVERAVTLLIDETKKKRFGIGRKARASRRTGKTTRHVPAAIQRAVFERDGGRCTFVDGAGRRCEELGWLELDHVEGFARTGEHSVDGLRLRCTVHNAVEAERLYGREWMQKKKAAVIRPGADEQGPPADEQGPPG